MSNTINVLSTVAQAEGFEVEVRDTTLLSSRYFPTTPGEEFAGKEVLFDFESSDLAKGAFISSGYKQGNVHNWTSNSVVPPRVGSADSIDPKDQDRVLFERLCRAQGADLDRSEAYQNLLSLKAVRLAARTDRAKELLAALVLKEGKIDFDQDADSTGATTDHILCKFYDPAKGANNHFVSSVAWTAASGTHCYADVCDMLTEGMKHGRKYTDLVLGPSAWSHLAADGTFQKFAGNVFHSEGMVIDFGDVDGAQHVASAVFNGVQLNVIVYGGSYVDNNVTKSFIDSNAAILIAEGIGRGLQGGCTLLNPNSNGYGLNDNFVGLTGVHMQSIYKDFNAQKLYIREESRPLPAPKHSVNEFDWIYCDTSLSLSSAAFGEVAEGVSFDQDSALTWATDCSCAATCVLSNSAVAITEGSVSGKHVKLYSVKNGVKSSAALTVTSNKIVVPIDNDRDSDNKFIIYATAE